MAKGGDRPGWTMGQAMQVLQGLDPAFGEKG